MSQIIDLNNKKINILGTEYTIVIKEEDSDLILKDSNGYCDWTIKEIVISDLKDDVVSLHDLECYKKKVLLHELIHAFLIESGLDSSSDWARNEEMVDFFARQIPKIVKAFESFNLD